MTSNKAVFYYFCLTVSVLLFLCAAIVLTVTICVSGDSADGYILAAKEAGIGCAFLIPPILYKRFANEDKGQPYGGVPVLCIVAFIMLCGIASVFLSQGFIKTATALYLIACIPLFIIGWLFVKAFSQGMDGLLGSAFPGLRVRDEDAPRK